MGMEGKETYVLDAIQDVLFVEGFYDEISCFYEESQHGTYYKTRHKT
jgi:hypothetical protein